MQDSRFDLIQAIVIGLFAAMGGAVVPLASLDHWQKVLAGFLAGAASGFSGSLAHDGFTNRPPAPPAALHA
jgi:hypothetical protein